MNIAVIIPTYKRPRTLLQTLASLQQQTVSDFEVLVMDNAAEPAAERAVAEFNETAKVKARYIPCAEGGNSEARNRGAKEARAELLVFTDDDLTFAPDWLAAYRRAFDEHPEMVAAGGRVKLHWEEPPPQWLLDYIGDRKVFHILAYMEPSETFTLGSDGWFFSCNMALRRSVFDRTGLRPEMRHGRTIGNGEAGLNGELSRKGELIGYVPDATVFHHIPPSRMTVGYIRRWAWHLGGSEMFERWWNRRRTAAGLGREAASIVRRYWRCWAKALWVKHRRDCKSIDVQFHASLGWCRLAYVWWMFADPLVKKALDQTSFRP